MGNRLTGERDGAPRRRQMPHQGTQRRGLAHAVVAENAEILAILKRHVETKQDWNAAVAGSQIADLEKRAHAATFLPR